MDSSSGSQQHSHWYAICSCLKYSILHASLYSLSPPRSSVYIVLCVLLLYITLFTILNCLDLKENSTLNSRAAAEAHVDGEFKLEDFTYTTSTVLKALSGHLSRTNFSGITVRLLILLGVKHCLTFSRERDK